MSLASLYTHLCHFQSENVVQISVTLQATILLRNQQFDEKSLMKSTTAGTHTEAQSILLANKNSERGNLC